MIASGHRNKGHGHYSSSYITTPPYENSVYHSSNRTTPAYENSSYAYVSSSSTPMSKTNNGDHRNKRYTCDWPGCEKRFERQNALDTHMNIHTEEKPYPCPAPCCGKVFNVRSNMRRHLLTHKDYPIDQ
ncbi:hypothetical protein K439DRAFT_287976 [Ramaria rubella]|nr:hypothetical protein K439DRAFT_287976 [Ramaria rubella]